MSDMTFTARTRACDWPGCAQTTDDSCDGDWLHTEDGHDYCLEHWHFDDYLDHMVPGPDPTPPMSAQEQERLIHKLMKYGTATRQDAARWEAHDLVQEAKRSVDDAVGRLHVAIVNFETAGQTQDAQFCLPVINGLVAQSIALDGLDKRLGGEAQ